MKKYNLPSSSDIGLNEMEKRSENSDYIATEAAYDASYTYTIEDDYVQSDEERTLVRKLDILIMPIVCVLVFMQFLDKSAINYAALFGFKEDLNLQGSEYSLLGSMFYLGYLIYQLPNNYLLQRIPVGRYIGITVTLWGLVLALTALGKNFSQVAAMRFLLGLLEAGIYPSLTLLVSTFYRRSEQAARLGAFWIFNGIALILGGLISYGIGRMDPNTLGLHQWQWIMVILGAVTMFMGVFSFFFLIDNPKSRALRLNAEQEILVEERTRDNAVVRTTTIKHEHIREALGELRLWCFCFAGLFINLQNGAMTNYNAQITNDFGFDILQSVLLSTGSGGFDIVFIVGAVWCVRKTGQVLYTACGLMLIDIIGLILLETIPFTKAKLVGFYLAWSYCAAWVLLVTSISNNVSGYTKKIFYNGMLIVFYTIGNFCGPLMMTENQKPSYLAAMITYIIANALCIVLLLIARWKMATVNNYRMLRPSGVVTNVEDDLSDIQDPNFLYRL